MAFRAITKQTDVKVKDKRRPVKEIIVKLKENERQNCYEIEDNPF